MTPQERKEFVDDVADGVYLRLSKQRAFNKTEAAKEVGVSPRTITRAVQKGKIKMVDGKIMELELGRFKQTKN